MSNVRSLPTRLGYDSRMTRWLVLSLVLTGCGDKSDPAPLEAGAIDSSKETASDGPLCTGPGPMCCCPPASKDAASGDPCVDTEGTCTGPESWQCPIGKTAQAKC